MMVKIRDKVLPFEKIHEIKKQAQNKKTVVVGGCFDIIHYGHLVFLKKAKKAGDRLIVLLESDQFFQTYKKRKSLHSQSERAEILASLLFVDCIVTLPFLKVDDDYLEVVKIIDPDIIAVTDGDPAMIHKKNQAKEIGAVVKIVCNRVPRFSTSKILDRYAAIS